MLVFLVDHFAIHDNHYMTSAIFLRSNLVHNLTVAGILTSSVFFAGKNQTCCAVIPCD
jgi:hypothetical protein